MTPSGGRCLKEITSIVRRAWSRNTSNTSRTPFKPAYALTVEVSEGVVTVTGSVVCEDCGGRRTPGGFGTVQQSLGAVVRAIPGVQSVEFTLEYTPPEPPPGGGGG